MICYACQEAISEEQKSLEHVIPNSIGGRLKSATLICRDCNTRFGLGIDAEFARVMHPFTALFAVARDRTKQLSIKNIKDADGTVYHLHDGRIPRLAKPEIKIKDNSVEVTARDEKEMMGILLGLKRKYPDLDIANAEEKFVRFRGRVEKPLTIPLTIGGHDFFRAITKIAVNAYLVFGGDKVYTRQASDFINGDAAASPEFANHYYEDGDVTETGDVSHTVHVRGIKSRRLLYVYIQLFGALGFIVRLSDEYESEDVNHTYSYNIITQSEVAKSLDLQFAGRLLGEGAEDAARLSRRYIQIMQALISQTMRVAWRLQFLKTYTEAFARALASVRENDGTEDAVTHLQFEKAIALATQEIESNFTLGPTDV